MNRVIEFPKNKASEEGVEPTARVTSKKVFNIADWAPDCTVQLNNLNVDAWPFCAA